MDYEIGSYESRKGGKGIRKFRRPKNRIKNKILYGLLFATDMDNNNAKMKVKDFAEKINVNIRSAEAWVFEGRLPNAENRKKICKLLGYPESILFHDIKC